MTYLVFKALHIIGFVSWFAGLLYFPRLLIYELEGREQFPDHADPLSEQLALMQRRLWSVIATPAMIFTWACGAVLLSLYGQIRGWVVLKLVLLVTLTLYHAVTQRFWTQMRHGRFRRNAQFLRGWNEVGTALLIAIVLTATLKDRVFNGTVWAGVTLVIIALAGAVKGYKRMRHRGALTPNSAQRSDQNPSERSSVASRR